jgi:hypothetical protein
LNEPEVAHEDRVKRGLCERLYSANEMKNLKLDERADAVVVQLHQTAGGYGWKSRFDRDKPVVDGTKRPSIPRGISRAVAGDPQDRVGGLLWGRLSAVTHVTWFGVQWAFHESETEQVSPGLATVPLGADSTKITTQAICLIRALRVAASRRAALMGWDEGEDWREAVSRAEAFDAQLVKAGRAESGQSQPLDLPR